jgi:tetratricopeptide (TPR) repeat protein
MIRFIKSISIKYIFIVIASISIIYAVFSIWDISKIFISELHVGCGIYLKRFGLYDRSVSQFDTAIKLDDRSIPAYDARALLYNDIGEYSSASDDAEKAIAISDVDWNAWAIKAVGSLNKYDYYHTILYCDRVLNLVNDWPWIYNIRAKANFEVFELTKAKADSDRALTLDPKFADAYDTRGRIYYQYGELELALADLNECLRLNANLTDAYFFRGLVEKDLKEQDLAISDLKKFISLGNNKSKIYLAKQYLEQLK